MFTLQDRHAILEIKQIRAEVETENKLSNIVTGEMI